jgi:hypothetical protein
MRNLIIAAALTFVGTPVAGQVSSYESEFCYTVGEFAKEAANARQRGVSMRVLMDTISKTDDAKVHKLLRLIIMAAYERPRYSSQQFIQGEITDFENEMYLMCVSNITEK